MSDTFQDRMSNLSPREKQICDVLKHEPGLTLRGVGVHLGISHHTVNIYLRRIYDKTGVNNKTALVANLYRTDEPKNVT